MNLCVNAVQAMGDTGTLTIATRSVELSEADAKEHLALSPGTYLELRVSDTGEGMDRRTLKQAFDPFFTTKPLGAGTGLGLAMVYGAVETHGGTISLSSEAGRGTTATVLLPAASGDEETRGVVGAQPAATEAPNARTVLVVDDERSIRWIAERVLGKLGYRVIVAEDGERALDEFQAHRQEVDLVVLDLAMPGMGGIECFERLRDLDPGARVLVSSGYAPDGATEKLLSDGAVGFLQKPFKASDLAEAIATALRRTV